MVVVRAVIAGLPVPINGDTQGWAGIVIAASGLAGLVVATWIAHRDRCSRDTDFINRTDLVDAMVVVAAVVPSDSSAIVRDAAMRVMCIAAARDALTFVTTRITEGRGPDSLAGVVRAMNARALIGVRAGVAHLAIAVLGHTYPSVVQVVARSRLASFMESEAVATQRQGVIQGLRSTALEIAAEAVNTLAVVTAVVTDPAGKVVRDAACTMLVATRKVAAT